jgi:hypothetical protein
MSGLRQHAAVQRFLCAKPVVIGLLCALGSPRRIFDAEGLAEGEELRSNILRVVQRSPANTSVWRRERNWGTTVFTFLT